MSWYLEISVISYQRATAKNETVKAQGCLPLKFYAYIFHLNQQ